MGNPAEKTIRNPNLDLVLVKVRGAVNRNIILPQIFLDFGESIENWPVKTVYTNCICTNG
jgi:hypothetical protein